MSPQQARPERPAGFRLRTIVRALESRNYRLFFMGHGTSLVGTWMQRVAQLWLVGKILFPHDPKMSALWLGIIGFAGQIPSLAITPLAGVLADRIDRRKGIIITQALAMIQAGLLAYLTLSGQVNQYHVLVLAIWLGVTHACDMPLRQSFMVKLVDRPEHLSNAIALNSTIVNGGRLIGPSLGGLLVAWKGPGFCFAINAASYLAVIASLMMIRVPAEPIKARHEQFLRGLATGFRHAIGSAPIRRLLGMMALVSLTGIPYVVLLPIFVSSPRLLGGDSRMLGLLMGGIAVGALAAAILLASRQSVRGLERWIGTAPLIIGGGLVVFSLSRTFWLSLAVMPVVGLGQMLLMASTNTMVQTLVDDDKRGRVISFYALSFMGVLPIGNLLYGLSASSAIGAPTTVLLGGLCCGVGGLAFLAGLPSLQRAIGPILDAKGVAPAGGVVRGGEQPSPPPSPATLTPPPPSASEADPGETGQFKVA